VKDNLENRDKDDPARTTLRTDIAEAKWKKFTIDMELPQTQRELTDRLEPSRLYLRTERHDPRVKLSTIESELASAQVPCTDRAPPTLMNERADIVLPISI
jgi:hypothetical protein